MSDDKSQQTESETAPAASSSNPADGDTKAEADAPKADSAGEAPAKAASGDVFSPASLKEHIGFDMNKEIMIMTGREVVLSQGPNVVVGNKLTVNLKTGQANLTAAKGKLSNSGDSGGRVKVRILPNSVEEN